MWGNRGNWMLGGDGWDFHARSCEQPYEAWKMATAQEFLLPHLGPAVDVVEIGPGQGRWSRFMVGNARTLTLVDLSPSCIDECRRRLADDGDGECASSSTTGRRCRWPTRRSIWSGLSGHSSTSSGPKSTSISGEIERVLRPGGIFVIHHPGRRQQERGRRRGPEERSGEVPDLARPEALLPADAGFRSDVTAAEFASLAVDHTLVLDRQVRTWGSRCQYGLAFQDVISTGRRPSA